MTRKLRRTADFEIRLDIKSDRFIAPPRAAQRNWLLNRVVAEWAADLLALDEQSRDLAAGRDVVERGDLGAGELADQTIMEDWQIPVMRAMADIVGASHGDVLEIGFGRGISADFIQQAGVRSHTIVECNDHIVQRFQSWRQRYADRDIRLLHGLWQDLGDRFERYDAVFFHAYPLSEQEFIDDIVLSTTYAESFFPVASAHLRPGGVFTYLSNETSSLSRAHQRLLFGHFDRFTMSRVGPLQIPDDTGDTLWGDTMVVVGAVK